MSIRGIMIVYLINYAQRLTFFLVSRKGKSMRNCVTAVIRPGVVDVVIRENEKKAVLYATPYECHVLSNNGVVITPEELNHFTCEARKNYKQYI